MPHDNLTWRCFRSLPAGSEAAIVSKFCLYSLATLEVAMTSEGENFALVEKEHADCWRWAVFNPDGFMTDGGSEPTLAHAKNAVGTAFHLSATSDIAVSNG